MKPRFLVKDVYMKRLGKFSGNIYDRDEVSTMKECGIMITDEQAKDEEFIKQLHLKEIADCLRCPGCPMTNKND